MRKLAFAFFLMNFVQFTATCLSAISTTIAYDGVTLAADSQVTNGETKRLGRQKIVDCGSCYLAGAGNCTLVDKFTEFLKHTTVELAVDQLSKWPMLKKLESKDAHILIVQKKTGAASLITVDTEGRIKMCSYVSAPYAIGSGQDYALGAMAHGANAIDAVEVAKSIDLYTGGDVHSVNLK